MIFYYIIFFILFCFTALELKYKNRRYSYKTTSFFLFIFFILSFIRWEVGTDWDSYFRYYNGIKGTLENVFYFEYNRFEIGYEIINHFAKSISNSYSFTLFIQAIIIYLFWAKALIKLSVYPLLSLFIFFCMSFASIFFVRQNIAMAILIFSVYFIDKKNWKAFLSLILLAFIMHRSSIVFLIAYPIYHKYYSSNKILFLLIISIFIGIFIGQSLLTYLGALGMGAISAKIEYYMSQGENDHFSDFSITQILIKGSINRLFLFFIYMFVLNKFRKKNKLINGLINLNILGMVLYFVLTPISLSLGRLTVYFDILQLLIIPYVFHYLKNNNTKIILYIIISAYLALRLYSAIFAFKEAFIPYKTIFI